MDEAQFSVTKKQSDLDKEWVMLILKAKQIGLTPSEVRHFLTYTKPHVTTTNLQHD